MGTDPEGNESMQPESRLMMAMQMTIQIAGKIVPKSGESFMTAILSTT
jgi:hypothetical protein